MTIRFATSADFDHLETFVWQAVFPAFDVEGLTDEQRAENDALVETARNEVISALDRKGYGVFVAIDPKLRRMAGYVIVDAGERSYAEIPLIIVKKAYWGKGVAHELLSAALDHAGRHRPVSIAVRHYNDRAKAFFQKFGFEDTGELAGDHAIPRTLLVKEAEESVKPETAAIVANPTTTALDQLDFGTPTIDLPEDDFPTLADEPVFEDLPNYNLATDDTPIFSTGANALTTEPTDAPMFGETTLDEDTLSELEAFIARAKASKKGYSANPSEPSAPRTNRRPPMADAENPVKPPLTPSTMMSAPEVDAYLQPRHEPHLELDDTTTSKAEDNPSGNEPSFEFGFDDLPTELAGWNAVTDDDAPDAPSSEAADGEVDELLAPAPEPMPEPSGGEKMMPPHPSSQPVAKPPPALPQIYCSNCGTALPNTAKFCFNCGTPQVREVDTFESSGATDFAEAAGENEIEWDVLELPQLQEESPIKSAPTKEEPTPETKGDNKSQPGQKGAAAGGSTITLAGLKQDFRRLLTERVTAYFSMGAVPRYISKLEADREFQRVRDASLDSLHSWLAGDRDPAVARRRIRDVQADLVEFFLVEAARDLHRDAFPQRLLRHQSINWETVDIFRLVMDYLDFDSEHERVHTDFVTMPKRALKNATESFLSAAKDERILFICDQSLVSQAKNGFAMTDSAIYWKNVFQPAGQATYKLMAAPKVDGGHLILDNRFFDAGGSLNLKIALLLDKLRMM